MTIELMPPVETMHPREEDAHAIEQQAGYVVVELSQDGRAAGGMSLEDARRYAVLHARANPGTRLGIFKLVRDFIAEADKPGAATT